MLEAETNSDPLRLSDARDASAPVFLIGNRYGHHARHSGYEGFGRYIGRSLPPPVTFRFLRVMGFPTLGWKIDSAIGKLMGRECYSLGLLLTEMSAGLHAIRHPGAICHFLYGDTDVCWLGRIRQLGGISVVATFHEAADGLRYLGIGPRITRYLDAVILVSESQRAYFEELLPRERVFVVPHGVDSEFFRPDEAARREMMCLTVGGHLRDFETLSKAIDIVRARNPGVRFVAVGVDHGHEGPRFRHPDVEFLSGISDEALRTLYQTAGCAVFSFRQASANNSLLEAMACRTPVVATDVGGVREYLGDGGIFCAQGDPSGMAEGILRLLGDPRAARNVGNAGRDRAVMCDYRRVAAKQSEVYDTIAAARGRRP